MPQEPERCPAIETLVDLAALPPGDPRRSHLDACPRCQARLATYEEFLRAEPAGTGPRVDAALARLAASLDAAILGDAAGTAAASGEEATGESEPSRGRLLHLPRAARAVLAAAAALLLLVGLDTIVPRREPPIVLRAPSPVVPATLALEPPRTLAGGGLELSWQPHPEADAYLVIILAPDLTERARLLVSGEPRLRIEAARLAELLESRPVFAWKVIALGGGDELARSAVGTWRLDAPAGGEPR
ncbi:MAG: hypothetical protein JW819_02255 [Candidatus Krumholzibacteriota bacterium]|nr:hypothetical protein [Candidatus Krumholzibacteriota bacterium]